MNDTLTQNRFADAYSRNFATTHKFLMSKGIAPSTAEEVAQAAWTKGWERRNQLCASAARWRNGSTASHSICSAIACGSASGSRPSKMARTSRCGTRWTRALTQRRCSQAPPKMSLGCSAFRLWKA